MAEPGPARPAVAAFDFDGTISVRDTFLPFLVRAFGVWRVTAALVRLLPAGIGVWLGRVSRDHYKDLLVRQLFAGVPVEHLTRVGQRHAQAIAGLCRPAALERIRWHAGQGHRLVMVSASLDFYLEPLARELGFDDLLCTRVAQRGGVCLGGLEGKNCRAAQKVHCLRALLGPLECYELYAYGDSAGDAQMLAAADHPEFRPFRRRG